MKRIFDLLLSVIMLNFLLIPMLLISISVFLSSKGPILYWSNRIGRNNKTFKMPKFRSMLDNTPDIATHILSAPETYLSPIGSFLRSTSLDELPQLYSVLKGDMSFVGPRPALFNQDDLIYLRNKNGVDRLLPGITGWAQINGRDHLTIYEKVAFDTEYLAKKSFWFDIKILWITLLKVINQNGVKH
jgi:O-antigen biosynthesis protein WbqP